MHTCFLSVHINTLHGFDSFSLHLCSSLFRCFNTLDVHHHSNVSFFFYCVTFVRFAFQLQLGKHETQNYARDYGIFAFIFISFYFVCQYYFVRLKLNRYDASVHFACLPVSLASMFIGTHTHTHMFTLNASWQCSRTFDDNNDDIIIIIIIIISVCATYCVNVTRKIPSKLCDDSILLV